MSLLCLSGRYDQLYTYATFFVILAYAATGIALFVLRRTRPDLPRPYRCWGYPVVPLRLRREHRRCSPSTPCATQPRETLAGIGILLLGLPVYFRMRRRRAEGRVKTGAALLRSSLAVLALSAGPAPPPPTLTGLHAEAIRLAARVRAAPPRRSRSPQECEEIHREITRTPHVAGTDGQRAASPSTSRPSTARPAGRSRCRPTTSSSPTRRARRSRSSASRTSPSPGASCRSPWIPTRTSPEAALPWNAYSPSAEVVGEVVYVNHGSAEDYDRLAKMGIDVARQDRARPLLRRLPRRQVARSREARRAGDPRLLGPDRRRLVPGPGLSRRPVGAGLALPARAPTSTTSSCPAIR